MSRQKDKPRAAIVTALALTIRCCPRCGRRHEGLAFMRFQNSSIPGPDGNPWNFWTLCPNLQEPIMTHVRLEHLEI